MLPLSIFVVVSKICLCYSPTHVACSIDGIINSLVFGVFRGFYNYGNDWPNKEQEVRYECVGVWFFDTKIYCIHVKI